MLKNEGGDRLEDTAKVALGRLACGTALLITSAVTGVNGTLQMISLFLLGVPVEYIQTLRKES